ncbi:histidine kinase dimerization/phosphoacceptor domain -containing protein [Rubellimicrobium sp. CFH 75288]|uniref:histidine kinase dimerization/phosphoacceptor domain -containing protein n=1 Tax=Rubellimicrobium sp. CFH 75288 TaxID=2697034 RepID=UPI001412B7FE|nr:histidine kinase dimerization/phosphoacceptor domain -containing protein [Rubellimicrobium sp. CFH 75288]NAZ37583.1 hypothetical protein [Rubellimicrobium sp. CFH 75288]
MFEPRPALGSESPADAVRRLEALHHRVLNSFAALSAATAMELRRASPEARAALERTHRRIQAVGALYRQLDPARGTEETELRDYLSALAVSLRGTAALRVECTPLRLSARLAAPLGLLTTEWLAEALSCAGEGAAVRLHCGPLDEEGWWSLAILVEGPARPAPEDALAQALRAALAAEIGAVVETGGWSLRFRPPGASAT